MRSFFHEFPSSSVSEVFTFTAAPHPPCRLSFTKSSSSSTPRCCRNSRGSHKRSRPLSDVDGEAAGGCKKKRRLRLFLITSRLSRPFSAPPTHIVDRGFSKIALWAKQKASNRNQLRKAAILNSIKMHVAAVRESERKQMESARQAFMHQSTLVQMPRRQYIPLPPSPLGLSNYDAFDLEEDYVEEEPDDGEDPAPYDDFNLLDPAQPVVDDYDSLDQLEMLPQQDWYPSASYNNEMEMLKERQRQKELCFSAAGPFRHQLDAVR